MKAKNKTERQKKRIRKILIDKSTDVSKVARAVGKSRRWVNDVLYGIKKGDETRDAIATFLGIKKERLWPANNGNNNNKRAA